MSIENTSEAYATEMWGIVEEIRTNFDDFATHDLIALLGVEKEEDSDEI